MWISGDWAVSLSHLSCNQLWHLMLMYNCATGNKYETHRNQSFRKNYFARTHNMQCNDATRNWCFLSKSIYKRFYSCSNQSSLNLQSCHLSTQINSNTRTSSVTHIHHTLAWSMHCDIGELCVMGSQPASRGMGQCAAARALPVFPCILTFSQALIAAAYCCCTV